MKAHTTVLPRFGVLRAAATADATRFDFPASTATAQRLARAWLWLGIAALAGSGLFAVLLVLARTPGLQQMFPVADFFRVALVVHVDLSVLVWFAATAGMMWTVTARGRSLAPSAVGLGLVAVGCLCLVVAPFAAASGAAVMANYVPVLDTPLFLYGLVSIGGGMAFLVAQSLVTRGHGAEAAGTRALRFGLRAAALSAALALAALVWSWIELPTGLDPKAYYEALFWGPGHVLQFTWTLLMLVSWLWLAGMMDIRLALSPRVAIALLAVGLSAALIAPLIYLQWPVVSVEHHRMFTWLMRFGGGLAILPIALVVVLGLVVQPRTPMAARPLRAALIASIALFAVGGLVGFMIRGSDVRIPAHYHGSIVGVTLALMGVAYGLVPRLGGLPVSARWGTWQIWLYAGGQLMHVVGLLWSGGYGVQRKVAGADQVLASASQVAGMGLMGLGGLIAILGGLLFVVVMVRSLGRGSTRVST
jgi:heme/copper-type cytochrome/quinol oxidase subunit 1